MANLLKQIAVAAVVATVTIGTGGMAAAGAMSFSAFTAAITAAGISGIATMAAIQFGLGAVLGALAPKPASAQIAGALVTGRDPVASRKVVYGTRRVGGTQVFLGTHGAENKFLYMAIALAGHEVNRIKEVYFGEDRVYYWDGSAYQKDTSAPYYDAGDAELFNIAFYHGTDTQTADSGLTTNFPSEWTSNHRLQGIAYIVVQLKYDPNKYSNGVPNVTALVEGKEVYDPRDTTTSFSSNSALCILDYLRDDEYGLGVDDAEIDFTSFEYAADLCDETVALDAGGSEPRYTLNGIVDTSLSPKQVIEEMLVSMGGKLVYAAGRFSIVGAEYRTPTITIDEDDIISDISVITKNSSRDLYNGVRGVFASPDDLYQPVEYPTVESATYQGIDGVTRYTELNLPYTTSSATAQRLAKILLNQSRQELTIQMRCKLNALQVTVGDNIYVNNSRLGFTNKVFEVGTVSISPEADGTIGVDIMAREISQSTYDWTATDEQALITNVAPYSDNFAVPAPTNLSVSSSASLNDDGTVVTTWSATWSHSEARNFSNYEVQWKTSSETNYHSTYTTDDSISGVGDVVPGQSYTFRVRTVASTGAVSDFDSTTHVMAGDSSAPATPTGLTATGGFESITLDWNSNTESDLRGYYLYENTSNNSGSATRLGLISVDLFTRSNLPSSATRYYWVSAVDYSGNESSKSTVASATTDAGVVTSDTKAANGYVYYLIATQPSSNPSASSYNFNTGAFSGLSSNWSIQPPNITGSDAEYWASSWSVLDDNGSQTINFSTPFRSFQFDGLVTFTNLNNELADPNSSEITTISGGLIKTGTVDADRIQLDGNTIEASASGIRIKNLGVDTLQIADNAVTVPNASIGSGSTSITTTTTNQYFVVLDLSVSSIAGVPNLITFSVHAFSNRKERFAAGLAVERTGQSTQFLYIAGSQITTDSTNEILPNTTISGAIRDVPSTSGTDLYRVFLFHADSGIILKANARSIWRIAAKK